LEIEDKVIDALKRKRNGQALFGFVLMILNSALKEKEEKVA